MNSQKCSILLILQREEDNRTKLYKFLIEHGFDVFHAVSVDEGILKARECSPDLIICQNELEEKTGLQVFNLLHSDLIKKGTSFFLYMREYCKEDVLIGLEMGVDNFVFLPFDDDALTRKIELQLGKVKKIRIFDSESFKLQFEFTPVAKFVADNNRIIMMNPAFKQLTGFKPTDDENPKIDAVFDFSEQDNNLLNYRKCLNGLKDSCLFQSVMLKANNLLQFDIHLVCTDYLEEGLFMAEIVPAGGFNGNGNTEGGISFQVPLNGNGFLLTTREKEVLEWSAQGLPIKQIASILRISERTVEKHRANIMAKTETSSIVEAIYAIRRKMR
ncbi:MAG TPA: LuxR C-terminal-related transcriptional regulator [Tangfeifania sp.]|nr:LuxR C-terminal-related transcriptional regulator [Tangfeifania sp.]